MATLPQDRHSFHFPSIWGTSGNGPGINRECEDILRKPLAIIPILILPEPPVGGKTG
jgi:hypothetical protein